METKTMTRPSIAATRAGLLLLAVCVTALGLTRPVAAQHELIAEDPANDAWQYLEDTRQAVFVGDDTQKTPSIILDFFAMAQTPARLIVQSDTKTINFKAGQLQFDLSIRKKRDTKILLDAHPDRAVIRVKGKQAGAVQGAWLRMCREQPASVTVTFTDATYANITFVPDQGAVAEKKKTTAAPIAADPAPEENEPSTAQMLKGVKQGVFQLRARGQRKDVFNAAAGFLVAEGGLAITNFHVIQGATGALAHFAGSDTPVAVELVAARADLDLALIQLKLVDAPQLQKVKPLVIETIDTVADQNVWAVGDPLDLGYALSAGVVHKVQPHAKLPDNLRQSLGFAGESVWIETDAAINSGNAGGPMVNKAGRVVAVNTWVWHQRGTRFYALSSSHISDLLESRRDQPLTFARAATQFEKVRPARGSFPRVIVAGNGHPEKIIDSAQSFRTATGCKVCRNRGAITQRVQDGYTYEGPVAHPKYVTKRRTCPSCRGTLIQNRKTLNKAGAALVMELAGSDPLHPRYDDAKEFTKKAVGEALEKNSKGLGKVLNAQALKLISSETGQVGAPLLAVGQLAGNVRLRGEGKRLKLFKFQKNRQQVVISDARLIETTGTGTVMVAGLLAGFVDDPKGESIPVIQHGLVIDKPDIKSDK